MRLDRVECNGFFVFCFFLLFLLFRFFLFCGSFRLILLWCRFWFWCRAVMLSWWVFYHPCCVRIQGVHVQHQDVAVTLPTVFAAIGPVDWGTFESRALFFVWMLLDVLSPFPHCLLNLSTSIYWMIAVFVFSLLEHWRRPLSIAFDTNFGQCCWDCSVQQLALVGYWLEIVWLMVSKWSVLQPPIPCSMMIHRSAFEVCSLIELSWACHCCLLWWAQYRYCPMVWRK